MARLISAPFRDLVTRLYREPAAQGTLFELPRQAWYRPGPGGPDLTVDFLGARVGNPLGVAAGPRTQMAQNLLLSYVAGGRILELSREHGVTDALPEYVAGSMLIEVFRQQHELTGGQLDGLAGAVVYNVRVGADLAGVRSDETRRFLDGMRAAGTVIERLRAEIPRQFGPARERGYPTRIAETVRVSLLPACSAEQIEKTAELLIAEHDFNVVVEVSPAMLGRERLEHLLCGAAGDAELRVDPEVFASGVSFDEAVELCRRLMRIAGERGRRVGFDFSDTLRSPGHRESVAAAKGDTELVGRWRRAVAMTLADELRKVVGPQVPVSLGAGVDRDDFASAVACGSVPVGVSTNRLGPGDYWRLPSCLDALTQEMEELDAVDINEFVLRRFGQAEDARRRAAVGLGSSAGADELHRAAVAWAGLLNTSIVVRLAREDRRHGAGEQRGAPALAASRAETGDGTVCDERLTVCPNAANFAYPTPVVSFDYHDVIVEPDGSWHEGPEHRFEITADMQIACYADFCDECSNCDMFRPEYDESYIDKPSFFGSVESWRQAAPRDGFVVREQPEGGWIRGRVRGAVYQLTFVRQTQQFVYDDGVVEALLSGWGHQIISIRLLTTLTAEHRLDMGVYHMLRYLRDGVLDQRRVNPVNVQLMSRTRYASGTPR